MTTLTYEDNTIMAYVGAAGDVVGVTTTTVLPYWEGNYVYMMAAGTGAAAGLRKFNIDPDGSEALQKKRGDIGVNVISNSSGGAAALDYNGAALYFPSDPFNWDQFAKVNTSNFSLAATFGTSASFATEDGTHVLDSHYMVTRDNAGSPNLVSASLSSLEHITTVNAAFGAFTYLAGLTEAADVAHGGPSVAGAILCSGGGAVSNTHVYAFGLPFQNGSNGANSGNYIGVYRVDGSLTRVGQFKATDLDATWTRITSFAGGAYDETDGNLICGAETDESGPSNKKYIFKVSATTGAILWKCAVNYLTPYQWGFANSRIRNGIFHYLGLSSMIYHIDTANGVATTEVFAGLFLASGPQCSDDVTNSIILYGTFTAAGSPPDYVGAVMDTGGNHNLTAFLRVWFATEPGSTGPGAGPLPNDDIIEEPTAEAERLTPQESVIGVQRWLVRSGHIRKWGDAAIDDLKLIIKRGIGSNETEPQIWVRANRDNKGFGKWKKKGLGKKGDRVTTLTFGGFGSAEDWQFEFCCTDDCDIELQGALVKVTQLG